MLPRRRPFFPPLEQQRRAQFAALIAAGALVAPSDVGTWGLPITSS